MDKFLMNGKWFWVGMALAVVSGPSGIVFGVALLVEPEHRKEGAVITVWSVFCTAAVAFWALSLGR